MGGCDKFDWAQMPGAFRVGVVCGRIDAYSQGWGYVYQKSRVQSGMSRATQSQVSVSKNIFNRSVYYTSDQWGSITFPSLPCLFQGF